jgi:hypothetical protein
MTTTKAEGWSPKHRRQTARPGIVVHTCNPNYVGGSQFEASSGKVSETLPEKSKRTAGVAQVLEHLPSKHRACYQYQKKTECQIRERQETRGPSKWKVRSFLGQLKIIFYKAYWRLLYSLEVRLINTTLLVNLALVPKQIKKGCPNKRKENNAHRWQHNVVY